MILQNSFFQPFWGVVEDRMDPMELGRVRVRIYGDHPFGKTQGDVSGLETEDLLWFNVMLPVTSASESGIGVSPTGVVEGTSVFGLYLDKYKTSGIILGTWAGTRTEMPNFTEGFSDPSGYYPTKLGSDVNDLGRGGEIGINSEVNKAQDLNRAKAPNPDNSPQGDIEENDAPITTIEQMLRADEGVRTGWYRDSLGYPTIGIGHLIKQVTSFTNDQVNSWLSSLVGRKVVNGKITMDEVSKIFQDDLKKMQEGIKKNPTIAPVYNKVNRSRQMALENMAFQMGVGGLAKFKKVLGYMLEEEWEKAYLQAKQSLWYRQTKGRAARVSLIIRNGNLESYGEINSRRHRALSAPQSNINPEDPYVPSDSRVMFEEPEAPYKAQYPYNHVYTSESGIVQEFDDTPGQERYRLSHPSGTYTETNAAGRQVNKIVGDRYQIVQGTDHILVQGDVNLVIGGNSKVYIMGDVHQTVDGNITQVIRGNVTQNIEGNVKATIDQTADITVKEEAYITVEKDLIVDVEQNATINVVEKATINAENIEVNADDTIEFNSKDILLNSSRNTIIDSGSLSKVTGGNVQVG
ncbi:baseplate hub structural protein / lysozyme R [Providencia phage PSTCR6]|nr:baseplate hub structural protein / lysozyme R [Providencia phage PSTCR6]